LRQHYKKHHVGEIQDLPKDAFTAITVFRKNEGKKTAGNFLDEEDKRELIREYDTPVYKETLENAKAYLNKVGILGQFDTKNCFQSYLKVSHDKLNYVLFGDDVVYKYYTFKDFVEDQKK
jgi:hypothetical protein